VQTCSEDIRNNRTALAKVEKVAVSLESAVDRMFATLDSLHSISAELRVARSLPSLAAITEEVRSLSAAYGALRVSIQGMTAPEEHPQKEDLKARVDVLALELGRLSRFVLKVGDDRVPRSPVITDSQPRVERAVPIAAQFEQLQAIAPRAFLLWRDLLEFNQQSYSGFPVHSCSVKGHPSAAMFASFVNEFLRGDVLDIGCGPQPVPLYLQHYPSDHIYGVDPISSPSEHPFHFYRGLAEFLPWNDASFDTVIAATSLDHVLLLDRSMREIHRVMKADGEFLVWVAFVAGSAPYDPCSPEIEPVDQYHLFHFTEEFFEATLVGLFAVSDKLRVNLEIDHHFYRLRRLPLEAASPPSADARADPT